MKSFFNTLIWAASLAVILGAYITQIPVLVTIATALYWIVSIAFSACFIIVALCFLLAPQQTKQGFNETAGRISSMQFVVGTLKSFTLLGTYAVVGWTFPFAMTLIFVVLTICTRFKDTQTG